MKVVLFALSLFFAFSAQAQTIHWLTFIDTTDKDVGEMDKNGQALLFSRFRNVVNAALASYGYTADNQEFFGNQLTPQNCKSAVERLRCEPNDIAVFYYIGHGTHAAQETNNFPQMLMGKGWSEERMFIPLYWVHEQMKSKGARLCLTIGMCCNPIQIASAKDRPTFSSSSFRYNYGSSYLSDAEIDRILTLFLESKGSIIQASAAVGELSWGYKFQDMGMIDSFTRFLILQFEDMMKKGSTLTWNSFLGAIGNNVSAWQKEVVAQNPDMIVKAQQESYSPYQDPINEIRIERCSRPIIDKSPTPPNPDNADGKNLEEIMEECLSYISHADNPLSKRIATGQRMKQYFAPSAKVKILSQDGDRVVNSKDATDYISLTSKVSILLNVEFIALDVNQQGLITKLEVKEYYRK